MQPAVPTARAIVWVRRVMAAALLLALPLSAIGYRPSAIGQQPLPDTRKPIADSRKPMAVAGPSAAAVEVLFIDDSTMKLTLRDECIELNTPYGKLLIPVRDIEQIEVATRIPDDIAKRIEAAIAGLGKPDFHRREAASAELLELGERAYPALVKAEKSSDPEVMRRARDVLEKIRAEVPAEHLEFRPHDVVYTADSKFTGRITSAALKVYTFQFGEQQLKLTDVRWLRSPSAAEPEPANVQADPGNLHGYLDQVGKTFAFRVTGVGQGGPVAMPGGGGIAWRVGVGGSVWGTDVYTLDSSLAMAAVHAGVLKAGQTGVVRVKVLGPQAAFQGSTRHGITSAAFGFYNGAFQFVRGRARPER